jgi:tetratricopeptide (TPR) repeat protein
MLGVALLAYEFKPDAQVCLQEAERQSSTDPRWPYFYGLSLFPESTEAGLKELEKAVELHGNKDSSVRSRFATILSEQGRYDEAAKHFEMILDRWPNDAAAVLGIGKIHFARGDFQTSLPYLTRAAENEYSAKAARRVLVTVYARLGDKAQSERVQQELANMPEDAPFPDPFIEEASSVRTGRKVWLDHATQLYRRGQIDDALPWVERTIQAYPNSGDAWVLMARLQMRKRQYESARESWQKAIDRLPDAVEAHTQLGVTLMHLGQLESASSAFRRAVELKPNLSEGYHNLGLCLLGLGKPNEASEAFRKSLQIKPGFADSYLGLAESLIQMQQIDEAQQNLNEVRKLNAADPRIGKLLSRYGL